MNKPQQTTVAVIGANGLLGHHCMKALQGKFCNVIRVDGVSGYGEKPSSHSDKTSFDFTKDSAIEAAASYIKLKTEVMDELCSPSTAKHNVLLNLVGVNYISWFEDADMDQFDRLMQLNVKSHLSLIKHLAYGEKKSWFKTEDSNGAVCEVISNASHMAMTNSVFYNASKAAQHMATMSLAREMRKKEGLCIFGVSPNKLVGTSMSDYIESKVPELRGWTPEEAKAYQEGSLAAGETPPEMLASFLADILCEPMKHKHLTNTVIPYGA